MTSPRFWSVELWSADRWGSGCVKVRKTDIDAGLSGIGWLSLGEYETRREALAEARRARAIIKAEGEDAAFVAFGQ